MGVEIERKFTVKQLPDDLNKYPFHIIEQAYLNVHPAIRVRRQDDIYYMTYKGEAFFDGEKESSRYEGKIGKVEYNMMLDREAYEHLKAKADGNVIVKKRYLLPINVDAFSREYLDSDNELKAALEAGEIKIELDVFEGLFDGRLIAEVEFPSERSAKAYKSALWFDEDVTGDYRYSNAYMSSEKL